ncbi:hypothetical protein D3C87_325240 [compost metagenome]
MKKVYLYECGNITEDLKELAQQILDNKVTVEFEVDYSECYYEGDRPSYQLLIKEKE